MEGTRNLLDALEGVGQTKIVAQSVAWTMRPGLEADAVASLEQAVLAANGVVLRYGLFYGPGNYPRVNFPGAARAHRHCRRTDPRSARRPFGHPYGRRIANPLRAIDVEGAFVSSSPVSTAAPATWRRPTLPAGLALAGAAITFTSLYLAAGALTPLLVVYQEQWDFPAALLTLAFAVYAIGFLAAVLTLGSLSDHVGRRPVLIGALIIQLVSNLLFLVAPDIGWVIAGRIVQGVAGGAATTAFTAALVELAPPNRKRLGTILGSVGLTGGLGVGSLLAGLAIQLTTDANSIVFIVLTIVTILGIVVVALSPETVTRAPGALGSLIPRVAFPPATRGSSPRPRPSIAAVWMLAGLSGGIAPSMVRSVFHLNSGLLNGLAGFIAPATSAVIGLVFARLDPRRCDDHRNLRIHRRGHRHHQWRVRRKPGHHDRRTGHRRCRLRCILHRGPAPHLPARAGASTRGSRRRHLPRLATSRSECPSSSPANSRARRLGADGLLIHHGDYALGARQPPSAAETGSSNVFCAPAAVIEHDCTGYTDVAAWVARARDVGIGSNAGGVHCTHEAGNSRSSNRSPAHTMR